MSFLNATCPIYFYDEIQPVMQPSNNFATSAYNYVQHNIGQIGDRLVNNIQNPDVQANFTRTCYGISAVYATISMCYLTRAGKMYYVALQQRFSKSPNSITEQNGYSETCTYRKKTLFCKAIQYTGRGLGFGVLAGLSFLAPSRIYRCINSI